MFSFLSLSSLDPIVNHFNLHLQILPNALSSIFSFAFTWQNLNLVIPNYNINSLVPTQQSFPIPFQKEVYLLLLLLLLSPYYSSWAGNLGKADSIPDVGSD